MPPVRHVIYLHGFTSSPASSKAARFARELRARGVGFSCPDFNEPAFETMTVTRMVEQTRREIAAAGDGPVALVGSSLGAFVAMFAATANRAETAQAATPRVDRLIFLAPALDFNASRLRTLGQQGIDEWRRRGLLEVFHYGFGRRMQIAYATHEDAQQYDAFALDVPWPTLVYQGTLDTLVDPRMVERWAAAHATVDLHLVKDDHQLAESVDAIWRTSEAFLGLA